MPPIAPNATSAKLIYKKFEKEFNDAIQERKQLSQSQVASVLLKLGFIDLNTSQDVRETISEQIFQYFKDEQKKEDLEETTEIPFKVVVDQELREDYSPQKEKSPLSVRKLMDGSSTKDTARDGDQKNSKQTQEDIPQIIQTQSELEALEQIKDQTEKSFGHTFQSQPSLVPEVPQAVEQTSQSLKQIKYLSRDQLFRFCKEVLKLKHPSQGMAPLRERLTRQGEGSHIHSKFRHLYYSYKKNQTQRVSQKKEKEFNFTPEINQVSQQGRSSSKQRIEILLQKGRKTKEKIEHLRKEKQEEGLKECVFKPIINTKKSKKKIVKQPEQRNPVLFADVITQVDQKSRITIYEGDDIEIVTQEFVETHSLNQSKRQQLLVSIRELLNQDSLNLKQ